MSDVPNPTLRRAAAIGAGLAVAVGAVAAVRLLTARPATPGDVRKLDLDAAPFPGQDAPDAVVVVPPGFDARAPLRVSVYFRGFSNCADNVVASSNHACTVGGDTRTASHLAQQLTDSRANTILVVPELKRDARSSDPGRLARDGEFARMMDEILGRHLADVVPGASLASVSHLGVMAHSGGYLAAAAVVRSRPAALRSVALLDALYAADSDFARWVTDHAADFSPAGGYRFADLYTRSGGTADRSQALYDRVEPALRAAGNAGSVLAGTGAQSLTDADLAAHPVVFRMTRLSHDDVASEFPRRLWAAGW